MGGSASRSPRNFHEQQNIPKTAASLGHGEVKDIKRFVLPIYYTSAKITADEIDAALVVWKMITSNKCEHFDRLREANPALEWRICPDYFPIVFYDRLFLIHPQCRQLFLRPINKQGGYLIQYISLCLHQLADEEKLKQTLLYLAQVHNKIGVKAYEYGILGEAFLWALEKVVGEEAFTPAARMGWTKIYSMMLDIMLPEVITFELANPDLLDNLTERRLSTSSIQPMKLLP